MKSTIYLQGGLGNQLFQYVLGRNLAICHQIPINFSPLLLKLPLDVTRRQLEITELIGKSITKNLVMDFSSLSGNRIFKSNRIITDKNFDLDFIKRNRNKCDIVGFFQTYTFIDEIWDQLKEELIQFLRLDKEILIKDDYLAMHLRLGDYLRSKKTNKFHGLSAPSYFLEAAKCLRKTTELSNFLVVTDSPNEARDYLKSLKDLGFTFEIVKNNHFDDLKIIYQSRGSVLSNSSFSWWAGFLSWRTRQTPIIVPTPWYTDFKKEPMNLIPQSWVKINRELYN